MGHAKLLAVVLVSLTAASAGAALGIDERSTPFRSRRPGEVIVPAIVNGAGPFLFLLDTGSTHTVISDVLSRTVGAPAVARTIVSSPVGRDERVVVRLDRLDLGPLADRQVLASVIAQKALDDSGRIQGIVGQDVLAKRRYTIDYSRRRVLWHLDGEGPPGKSCHAETFRLASAQGLFLVELPQHGSMLRLVLDSGADGLVLFEGHGRSAPSFVPLPERVELVTMNGREVARQVRVFELGMGLATLRDVPAVLVPLDDSNHQGIDGLLPLHLFERVTFDGPGGLFVVYPVISGTR